MEINNLSQPFFLRTPGKLLLWKMDTFRGMVGNNVVRLLSLAGPLAGFHRNVRGQGANKRRGEQNWPGYFCNQGVQLTAMDSSIFSSFLLGRIDSMKGNMPG